MTEPIQYQGAEPNQSSGNSDPAELNPVEDMNSADAGSDSAFYATVDSDWIQRRSPQPWGWLDIGLFVLFAAASMLLVLAAVMGGMKVLNAALGFHLSLDAPELQTPIAILVQVVWELLWLGFIYLIVVEKCGFKFWQGLKIGRAHV